MDLARLEGWFRRFADIECRDLPMYHRLCHGVADHSDLLERLLIAAPGQWRPNLMLAALHDIVLWDPEVPLARWYPTVGGAPDAAGDLIDAVRSTIETHPNRFAELIATRSTQTNEVNRSTLWPLALAAATADVDAEVALLEIGPSAGLNLRFDEYDIRYVDSSGATVGRFGTRSSPVHLRCEVRGDAPTVRHHVESTVTVPPIVARIGIDAAPVDLGDPDQHRWLKACIWPEQIERHERFDAAASHMVRRQAIDPLTLIRDDALDGLFDAVERFPAEAHLVVINSWMMTYLHRDRRSAFDRALDLLSDTRTLTHISAEGEGVESWVPAGDGPTDDTVVGISRWRQGVRSDQRWALCHPHLTWFAPLD